MKENNKGNVFWITGLSGAGKTTIGKLIYEKIKCKKSNVILWDGDTVRGTFCEAYDYRYDYESRKMGAFRDARVIKMLSDQGIDVVVCTIAMIHEIQDWNRNNIDNYFEIYLECPMKVLEERDQKHLYSNAKLGLVENVVGIDIAAEFPINPDVRIINDGTRSPRDIFEEIVSLITCLRML